MGCSRLFVWTVLLGLSCALAACGAGAGALGVFEGPPGLAIVTADLPGGMADEPYSATLDATGGQGTVYTWSIAAGALPGGLALTFSTGPLASGVCAQAEISGTLDSATGTFQFTILLGDDTGAVATRDYRLTIAALATPPQLEVFETAVAGLAILNGDIASGARAFGDTPAGYPSAPVTIVVSNTGASDLTLGAPVLGGANAADFTLGFAGFALSLAPGASTSFTLVANPRSAGMAAASVSFTHDAPNTASPFAFGVSANARVAWHNPAWLYRKSFTVAAGSVGADLANFPLLVSMADPDLRDSANGGSVGSAYGHDILFTLADGTTKLDHEIESYDPATGTLIAWVRLPNLASASDTVIYAYYGNTAATAQASALGVWDADYCLVQHFGEKAPNGPMAVRDSSRNLNHGKSEGFDAVAGSMLGATGGRIGGCAEFDGADDRIQVPATAAMQAVEMTWSFWVKSDAAHYNPRCGSILARHDIASSRGGLMIGATSSGQVVNYFKNPGNNPKEPIYFEANASIIDSAWHYYAFALTRDNYGDCRSYTDGVQTAAVTLVLDKGQTCSWSGLNPPLYIGGSDPYWSAFKGMIDEIRISEGQRSPEWIKACYDNESAPDKFCLAGPQELKP